MGASQAEEIDAELARAEGLLTNLIGEKIETITINSIESSDAPFLGVIVSKLSPIIGNLIEKKIVSMLHDETSEHKFAWIRQDPGFPDALLVDRDGHSTEIGYEVKAWYALSTELTGRFRESVRLLQERNVRVAVVAWMMSDLVYGTPMILDTLTVDALSVALRRDAHYHQPPEYLCVEPEDTTSRTKNLQQTNVSGYRLQESTFERTAEAQAHVDAHEGRGMPAHSNSAQQLAKDLRNSFSYRMDTNFAKIDRIDHADIEKFKARVLASSFRGETLVYWTRLLRKLSDFSDTVGQGRAAKVIESLYETGSDWSRSP